MLTVQDVTEIHREEEEGGRRQRLEALGRMTLELAAPGDATRWAGFASSPACCTMTWPTRPRSDEMTDQILAASAALETTVTNLLAFAAPPRAARRVLDLAALARDVCARSPPRAPCAASRSPGRQSRSGVRSWASPQGLRQVLLNLVGNALAATGQGGHIEVRCANEGPWFVAEVVDDGAGIAAEDLPRVFDPFFTRTEGGSGLGLSIVHRVVERHGGRITLDSQPGRARARAWRCLRGSTASGPRANFAREESSMPERILVVDDEPTMALAMQQVLARGGFEVDAADGAIEALAARAAVPTTSCSPICACRASTGASWCGASAACRPRRRSSCVTAYGTVESAVGCVRDGAINS